MLIVVGLVLAQDSPQMGLVPDEAAVQESSTRHPPIQRSVIALDHAVNYISSG